MTKQRQPHPSFPLPTLPTRKTSVCRGNWNRTPAPSPIPRARLGRRRGDLRKGQRKRRPPRANQTMRQWRVRPAEGFRQHPDFCEGPWRRRTIPGQDSPATHCRVCVRGEAARVRSYHRETRCHRFQRRYAERVVRVRVQQQTAAGVNIGTGCAGRRILPAVSSAARKQRPRSLPPATGE